MRSATGRLAAHRPESPRSSFSLSAEVEKRLDQERRLLGQEASCLGRDLALDWGTSDPLVEVAWLHASPGSSELEAVIEPTWLGPDSQGPGLGTQDPLGLRPGPRGVLHRHRRRGQAHPVAGGRRAVTLRDRAGWGALLIFRRVARAGVTPALLVERANEQAEAPPTASVLVAISRSAPRPAEPIVTRADDGEPSRSAGWRGHGRASPATALLHPAGSNRADDLLRSLRNVPPPGGLASRSEQSLTALAEFAAGAGHELNNPLGRHHGPRSASGRPDHGH